MQTFDAIVAGAGIWGCTVARRLAEAGKRVLVLEKRKAVGGNCRCEIDPETGIEVHTYGSHIFHTSNEEVWAFVRRFTEFNGYRHCVLAKTKATGRSNGFSGLNGLRADAEGYYLYHLPIGKTLLEEFFGLPMADKNLREFLATSQTSPSSQTSQTSQTSPSSQTSQTSQTSRTYGSAIFDAFIRGYTSKQWGVQPEKVDPSVIARLKVRDNYSTDYFDDPHQGIPLEGYNKMFERMLDHPNITVQCGCELRMDENEELRIRNEECRTAMAEKKIEEWLAGVDQASFAAALTRLVEEKYSAGEYLFEKAEDLQKAKAAAMDFFVRYSRRIVKLSDGRCVYFAPDPRSRQRHADNAACWAEYAFHAVSSGGDRIPGKEYTFRKYNEYKVINTDLIEPTLVAERCVPVLKTKPTLDSVKFFGAAHLGGLFDVVVRLDEYGNVNANMTEVTFEASTKRGQKKSPQLVSLTEAIRTVVSHQTATGTFPPNEDSIANPVLPRKGVVLPIYYSGPIDALFNYKYGALPWRTLRFERETLPVADYQGNAVVNYTDADVPFTRIHEFAHYHPESRSARALTSTPLPDRCAREARALREGDATVDSPKTIISREYSATWQPGDEPYYPIATPESAALLARYQSEVDHFNQTIKQSNNQTILRVGGRLGQYKYFDMDKSIAAALAVEI